MCKINFKINPGCCWRTDSYRSFAFVSLLAAYGCFCFTSRCSRLLSFHFSLLTVVFASLFAACSCFRFTSRCSRLLSFHFSLLTVVFASLFAACSCFRFTSRCSRLLSFHLSDPSGVRLGPPLGLLPAGQERALHPHGTGQGTAGEILSASTHTSKY
jgi:hypothetical protein